MSTDIDAVYRERNHCVSAIAGAAISLGCRVYVTKTNIPEWDAVWQNCIYIELPTGQVSWHFHDRDAYLFQAFPKIDFVKWDGHDTKEKYKRLNRWEHLLWGHPPYGQV